MKSCPACSLALEAHAFGHFNAEICPGCGGIWFGSGHFSKMMLGHELENVAEADPGPAPAHPRVHLPSLCIDCGQPLARFHYCDSAIELDRCSGCGGMFLPFEQLEPLKNRQLGFVRRQVQEQSLDHANDTNVPQHALQAAAELEAIEIGNTMRTRHLVSALGYFNRIWNRP